jgi:hypothetical protein
MPVWRLLAVRFLGSGYNQGTLQPAAPTRRFRWRRLFQYRLRTLLILTAVIAVWLGWWTNSARRQRDAVAALGNSLGVVEL